MAKRSRRVRRDADAIRELVKEYRASGLTKTEFAALL